MTTETQAPDDWVLLEAAKLSGYELPMNRAEWLRKQWDFMGGAFRALCDMIVKHEKQPVDRKLLCAREAMAENAETSEWGGKFRSGNYDVTYHITVPLRAIELWEEGFGK